MNGKPRWDINSKKNPQISDEQSQVGPARVVGNHIR